MKKIFIIAGMLSVGVFYAQSTGQDGSVGINTQPIGATLQVEIAADATPTHGQGIAVPNVTKVILNAMTGTIATSSLIYVTDASGSDIDRTTKVKEVGYHYFDGTEWVKLGGGAVASTPSAVPYEKIRGAVTILENNLNYTIQESDYLVVTRNNDTTTITFPATSESEKGRVIHLFNDNTVTGGLSLKGNFIGQNTTNQRRGRTFVSDGKTWIGVAL